MRILIGTDLFYPVLYSGGEVHLYHVAKNLVKLGHTVTVISSKTAYYAEDLLKIKDREYIDGIDIIRTQSSFKFGSSLKSLRSMQEMYYLAKKIIIDQSIDVVICNQYRPCFPLFVATQKKVPCVALFHDIYSQGKFLGLEGWADQKFWGIPGWTLEKFSLSLPYDHILTVSESTKKKLKQFYHEKKTSIIYNGVDLDSIDKIETGPKKPNQVIFVGSFKEHKNVIDCIEAVDIARQKNSNVELIICSPGGPQEQSVIDSCKTRLHIKYYKKVSDEEKFRLIKESSLLILPSSAEGFGLVLIEALACGTPFVAYNIPAVNEVCTLTGGGVNIPVRDINSLSECMIKLLGENELLSTMSSKGRKAVEERFTWDKVAQREEEILLKIINH